MSCNVEKFIVLTDLEKLSIHNSSYSLSKRLFSIMEKHYPERIHNFYVLNNHWFTISIFNLVKPLIPIGTLPKVKLLKFKKNKL
jgi:hypothetical protein